MLFLSGALSTLVFILEDFVYSYRSPSKKSLGYDLGMSGSSWPSSSRSISDIALYPTVQDNMTRTPRSMYNEYL
ncbi:uncharacterized protein EV420DRAFT_1559908 [Desarmillaria tabescens]|uniref:Uncharacterized protein n=1 Tax=Armillaria tabescens TaxID=1929756 RepID=A0AA39K057_ARMTA|nr:uncharacterized protein EV420DRAFT_1559908 [Desarmillaria tabescens]KAK0452039.1 hypothetical protein EV420DRAFT_1559908 [Desarmillaria tabescens]